MQDITKLTMDEKIARINVLYRKSKAEGLNEEEKEEQQALRRAYIDSVRNSLRGQLNNIDIESLKVSELEKLIIENPSILRRPIIVEDNKLQVGYNEEEIRVFIPKEIRKILMTLDCESCDYKDALKKYYYDQVNN